MGCYGPDKQKAELRLDMLDSDLIDGSDADMWQEVLDRINVSDMLPEDAKLQPERERRQEVVDALTASFWEATEAGRSTGGRNVLRRLTAYEYNNTLRDLLHLDLRYADDLPPEGAAPEGFKNNSSVLRTSALHLEYFERIACRALEKIILVPEEQPSPYFVRVEPELGFEAQAEAMRKAAEQAAADADKKSNQKRIRKNKNPGISYSLNGDHGLPGNRVKGLFRLDHGELAVDRKGILLAGNRRADPSDDPFAEDRRRQRR